MTNFEVLCCKNQDVYSGEDGRRKRKIKIKSRRRRRMLMGAGDWLLHGWYIVSQYQHFKASYREYFEPTIST
jgi:hypothetical protein